MSCFLCYCVPFQVYSASREDFLRFAGSGGGGGASDNVGIIRMQGLPYRATEEDIVRRNSCGISYLFSTCDHCEGFLVFSGSLKVSPNFPLQTHACTHTQVDFFSSETPVKDGEDGVLIVKFSDGRASGDAFAVFDSDVNLEKALEKDKTSMGSRYVELFRSSVKEFQLVRF